MRKTSKADIDAVDDRTLVRILRDEVLAEKAERVQRRRRGQADDEGVEIFEHLPPGAIDRAMAFVGDDEIEALDRNRRIVGDEALDCAGAAFEWGGLFLLLGQLLPGEHRIDALDGRDDDLRVFVEARGPSFWTL